MDFFQQQQNEVHQVLSLQDSDCQHRNGQQGEGERA
jgi:hypothetical protein